MFGKCSVVISIVLLLCLVHSAVGAPSVAQSVRKHTAKIVAEAGRFISVKRQAFQALQQSSSGGSGGGSSPQISSACAASAGKISFLFSGGSNFLPAVPQYCTSVAPTVTSDDETCFDEIVPGLSGILKAFCYKDPAGTQCINTFLGVIQCSGTDETTCSADTACVWQPDGMGGGNCVTLSTTDFFNAVCGDCFQPFIDNLIAAIPSTGPAAGAFTAGPYDALIAAFCVKDPSGNLCVTDLGLADYLTAEQKDPTANRLYIPSGPSAAFITNLCSSQDYQTCFTQIISGITAQETSGANDAYAQCMQYGGDSTSCGPILTEAQIATEQSNWLTQTICIQDPSSNYCWAYPAAASAADTNFDTCASALDMGSCSSSCDTTLNTQLTAWGCCFGIVAPDATTALAVCSTASSLTATACTVPSPTAATVTYDRRVTLGIPWTMVDGNSTLETVLLASLLPDIASRCGVSPDSILNLALVEQGTPVAAPASRRAKTLAGDTDATFTISGTSNAQATAAAATWDAQAHSSLGVQLPATNAALQQQHVLAPGASAVVATGSSASTTSFVVSLMILLATVLLL